MADRPTKPGPVRSRAGARAPGAAVEDDEERTRVAGPPPVVNNPGNVALPNHFHRSGEIEQRDQRQPAGPVGDWEEKTVVDDSQLTDPKDALSSLLNSTSPADEELTVDEPQKVMSLGSAAPKHTVRVQPPPPGQGMLGKLVVVAGNDRGREFPLTGKSISVGRGIDNDVVLTDIAVSRKHLSVSFDGTRYRMTDAGSGNGTLINDQVETGTRPLRHGDRIEIGNTVFRFEHPAGMAGAPGQRAPAPAAGGRAEPGAGGPAPGLAASALPAGGGAEPQRSPLPPPHRDEAGPAAGAPPAAMPAPPPAPGAPAHSPAGPPPGFPQVQPPFSSQGFTTPAGPAMPGIEGGARTSLATSLIPSALPSPRKTILGVTGTLLTVVALAALGLLLGDDEQLRTTTTWLEEVEALFTPADLDEEALFGQDATTAGGVGDEEADATDLEGNEDQRGDESSSAGGLMNGIIDRGSPGAPASAEDDERAHLLWAPIWGTDESLLAARVDTRVAGPGDRLAQETAAGSAPAGDDGQGSGLAAVAMVESTPQAEPTRSPAQARSEARGLYERKDFPGAAMALRDAATRAPKQQAVSLRNLASRYETLDRHIERANAAQNNRPGLAMNEYRQAQNVDRSLGGAHAVFLRSRLAEVTPRAAATYLDEGNLVQAKRAADAADQNGAGGHPQVVRVRQSLEKSAQKKYEEGSALRKDDPSRAQKLLEEVLRIVPPSSPWHAKAKQLLSLRRPRR